MTWKCPNGYHVTTNTYRCPECGRDLAGEELTRLDDAAANALGGEV